MCTRNAISKASVSGFDKETWVALQEQRCGLERNWRNNNEWSEVNR